MYNCVHSTNHSRHCCQDAAKQPSNTVVTVISLPAFFSHGGHTQSSAELPRFTQEKHKLLFGHSHNFVHLNMCILPKFMLCANRDRHCLNCNTYIQHIYTYANILQPIWVITWILCCYSTMILNYLSVDLVLISVHKNSIYLFSKYIFFPDIYSHRGATAIDVFTLLQKPSGVPAMPRTLVHSQHNLYKMSGGRHWTRKCQDSWPGWCPDSRQLHRT